MLGLGDYGDTPSPAAGQAGDEQASDAVADASKPRLLSIVDYQVEDSTAPTQDPPAALAGALLEDETAPQSSKVGGVGVQVSVVKRAASGSTPTAATTAQGPSASSTSADGSSKTVDIPSSPPGGVPSKLAEKYAAQVDVYNKGQRVNTFIREAKKFRNPCLLEKLVGYLGVQESGTNYPPELYDPSAFGAEEYYDALEMARKAKEERQSRKHGEKVEFQSSGAQLMQQQPAAAAAAGSSAAAEPPKRKSKWDTGGEPQAQRPRN